MHYGKTDPDAVWHRGSDESNDEAGGGIWGSVHGKGYFWGRIWGAPLYPMETLQRTCATVPRRGPLPKLLWAHLLFVALNIWAGDEDFSSHLV